MDNSENYKLSAIVLVYNGEKYLRQCLNSLVNQTLDNIEIILVNDASTDDSLSICKEYAQNYPNIKIIDKKINEGLASTGNIGIESAKGEYIILVDNDDIIPPYAYEKLYNKAIENNADVVTGKANFAIGKYQYELREYEHSVWNEERTLKSAKEFPALFHDVYYWNKIIKRSLIIDNNIRLPPEIMVYADRVFTHSVFIHANNISIIPDCVYLWRQRKSNKDVSLSMKRREAWNYIDRLNSFEIDLEKFTSFYENYFKILMRRIVIPITGILESEEFEEVFFERSYKLLRKEEKRYKDLYDNELDILFNLYIYLILHDFRDELLKLLKINIDIQKDIIFENGKNYWNLPCFRHSKIEIPDSLFEIKYLMRPFVSFDKIIIEDDFITFDKIIIPENFPFIQGEINFEGKTPLDKVFNDNKLSFELKPVDNAKIPRIFTVKIPTYKLKSVEDYDITMQFKYLNGMSNKFSLSKTNFNNIINKSEHLKDYLKSNNTLSIQTMLIDEAFIIHPEEDTLRFNLNNNITIKKPLNISIKNRRTNEIVLLTSNKNKSFHVEWEYFLDKNSIYDLYVEYRKKFRLNKKHVLNFKNMTLNIDNMKVKFYKNNEGNISLKT